MNNDHRLTALFPDDLACAIKIIAVKSKKSITEILIRSVCGQYRSSLQKHLDRQVDDIVQERYKK